MQPERRYPQRNRVPKRKEDMVYFFHVINHSEPDNEQDLQGRSESYGNVL